MSDNQRTWMSYAQENLKSAQLLVEHQLYNPCLQDVQQCVEKTLKYLILKYGLEFKKTHSILELKGILVVAGISIELTDDDCDFLDSIYLPSKYPMGSALPNFNPDRQICCKAVDIAQRLMDSISR